VSNYFPRQGDIVWLNFDPRAGHEQKGRRPAVLISNSDAHFFLKGRAMVCPITSTNKGFPLQPILDDRTKTQGVILCDQAMILDINARKVEYIEQIPEDILRTAVDIVYGIIEIV